MAKPAKKSINDAINTAADPSPTSVAQLTDADIARRAYDLYLARGGEHGHDLDDWLQAEHELRDAVRATAT